MSIIQFQPGEKTRKETVLDKSVDGLVEAMYELFLAERMTGRTGLPQRVVLAFYHVLTDAVRLAEVQEGGGRK